MKSYCSKPLSTTRDTGPPGLHANLPLKTVVFNGGGSMVTRGALVLIGASADDYIRAFDETSGSVLLRGRLPAGTQANPMPTCSAVGSMW